MKISAPMVLLLLLAITLYGQTNEINPGERFNERGFSTSASIATDGSEIISEYDGNLTLSFGTEIKMPNNMGDILTIMCNNNVEHRMFAQRDALNRAGYTVNAPEWIIGYKGIALQALNFEVNFFADNGAVLLTNLTGEQTPLLVPGYNYTNKIFGTVDGLYPDAETDPDYYFDFIQILKSDGSKLMLFNQYSHTNVGTYVEGNKDGYGYAVVETYYTGSAGEEDDLRNMYYYPGDGLRYKFIEENVAYNGLSSTFIHTKVFYLTEISNEEGDILEFNYTYHNAQNAYGRKNLGSIEWSSRPAPNYMLVDLNYNSIFITNNLGGTDVVLELSRALNSTYGYIPFTTSRSINTYASKIEQVTAIVDELGRRTEILYHNTTRKYEYSIDLFDFTIPIILPEKIIYPTGKETEFTYKYEDYSGVYDYRTYGKFSADYNDVCDYHRDFRTSYLLDEVLRKNKYGDDFITEYKMQYNYLIDTTVDFYQNTNVDGIKTQIITTNELSTDNSTPSRFTRTITYSKYEVGFMVNYGSDFSVITRKTKEVISDQNGISKQTEYSWMKGTKQATLNYWDGTFWLDDVTISESDGINTSQKTIDYAYSDIENYPSVRTVNIYNYKSFKGLVSVTSPSGIVTETKYIHSIPDPDENEEFTSATYYKIQKKDWEKTYKNTIVKSYKDYNYYTVTLGFDKLKEIIDNTNISEPCTTSFEYDFSGVSYDNYTLYKGLPTKKIYPSGKIVEFDYPEVVTNSSTQNHKKNDGVGSTKDYVDGDEILSLLYGEYLYDDGTRDSDKEFRVTSYQYLPLRTLVKSSPTTLVYETNSCYDLKQNLRFSIDGNGYYSEYAYDDINRVKRINLAGGFSAAGSTYTDTQISYDSYSSSANVNAIKTSSNSVLAPGYALAKRDNSPEIGGPDIWWINYYFFFEAPFLTDNISTLEGSHIYLQCTEACSETLAVSNLTLSGVSEEYVSGQSTYQESSTSIPFTYIENNLIEIDVSTIVNEFISNNATLYGFVIKVPESISANYPLCYEFSLTTLPKLTIEYQTSIDEVYDSKGNTLYTYNDDDNIVSEKKFFDRDPALSSSVITQKVFDGFGLLKEINQTDETYSNIVTKNKNTFNILDKTYSEEDAIERLVFHHYDGLGRKIETRIGVDDASSPNIKYDYVPEQTTEYDYYVKVTDEEEKETISYYNSEGSIVRKKVGIPGSYLTTEFNYNGIQQLTSVVSPEGITTTYEYDDWGNVDLKSSPDFGTYEYDYDCSGNLEEQRHKPYGGSTVDETIAHTYDNLNRLLTTTVNSNLVLKNIYDTFDISENPFTSMPSTPGTPVNTLGRLVATAYRDNGSASWNYKVYSYDHLGRITNTYIFE